VSNSTKLDADTVRPRPWTYRPATRGLGKWLGHRSLFDAAGEFIAGGFSEREADIICKAMTLKGAAARG
jgi:hypothetical protein